MAKEQLDTAERDSMIDAALAEQNAKRDAELAARMAARKQLLLEVTQGQRDQIQQHQRARYHSPQLLLHSPFSSLNIQSQISTEAPLLKNV